VCKIEHSDRFDDDEDLSIVKWGECRRHHCGYSTRMPKDWKLHIMNCNEPTRLQKLFKWLK